MPPLARGAPILVQHLVDEGRSDESSAATAPSVITCGRSPDDE
jgi:hypothetical protein